MKIEVDTVKGFQDYLPPASLKRKAVVSIIEKHYANYGFLPIETPVIEFEEIMKSESLNEDEAVSDRFKLKDRAGRNLGLRYEFTFQLARIFKQNPNIKMPFRRYQIGPVFRDEPVGTNRFRQFVQCDADIVGDSSIDSDFECLMLVSDILNELKIEFEVVVNNRKLISNIIDSVEMSNKAEVMRELDKLDKIGEDTVKFNLKKYGDANQIMTLFKMLEKDISFFKGNAFDGSEELANLMDKAKKNKLPIKFSPTLMRGLSYYTGNIFEVKAKSSDVKGSIAAGGRYDNSVGKFMDKPLPAVGISFGLERLTEIAKVHSKRTAVALISIGEDSHSEKLLRKMRKENISALMFKDKVGKALEYANSYEIKYAVFVGQDEIKKKKFKIKDLDNGEEKSLTEMQLLKRLKEFSLL